MTTDFSAQDQLPQVAEIVRWPRLRMIAAVAVAVAVLVSGGVYWRWSHTAAELLSYPGASFGGPLPIGRVMYVGADIEPKIRSGHERLFVRNVRPRITDNTVHATVHILTCQVSDPHLGVGMGFDTKPCGRVAVFRAGRFNLGFTATEIVYEITATRPGRLRIAGSDVCYSHGHRSGDQHAGSEIIVRVTR